MANKASLTQRKYILPFSLITTLFFLWGFARAILDVLNKHFQETLDISITRSALIQVTTFLAYFLMAIPAGIFITRHGYRRGVVLGLSLFGAGSLLFIPASWAPASWVYLAFLMSLFLLSCGLAVLETAANPYATELGPQQTATSRLNLSQSFNGLGSCLAPALVGGYLFGGGDVTMPYMVMGIIVLLIALLFSRVPLPEITQPDTSADSSLSAQPQGNAFARLCRHKLFIFGLLSLLLYEVAEISINSYFVNFVTMPRLVDGVQTDGLMSASRASVVLSGALILFMVGRFVGSAVMTRVKAEAVLAVCAACSALCMVAVLTCPGTVGLYALCGNYLFESIMFPTIFSLSLRGLGSLTKTASSLLMMTPVGGCFFLVTGLLADVHLLLPFVVPFVCFLTILVFAVILLRNKSEEV